MKSKRISSIVIVIVCCLVCLPLILAGFFHLGLFNKKPEENKEPVEDIVVEEKVSTVEMTTQEDGSIAIKGVNETEKEDVFCVMKETLQAGHYKFTTGIENAKNISFVVCTTANLDYENSELEPADEFDISGAGEYSIYAIVEAGANIDVTFKPELTLVPSFQYLQESIASAVSNDHIVISEDIDFEEPVLIERNVSIDMLGKNTNINFILQNDAVLTVKGKFEGINVSGIGTLALNNSESIATTTGTNGLTIAPNSDITLNIVGTVNITGAIGGDGIEVPPTSKFTLTGNRLTVIGNNGNEYSTLEGYGTTDDASYDGKSGSGIGNALSDIGEIYITDLKNLVAKGYGKKAFGIGGGDGSTITIENTTIEYVSGGYVSNVFKTGNLFGKTEAEGGCAIGVGSGTDVNYLIGTVKLNNVIINEARGGSKSAGIGAIYWNGVNIEISNSTLSNIWGGNCSAAIGGGRVHKTYPEKQLIDIKISNSKVVAHGGEYAAGIGSGYNTYCSQNFQVTNIEITKNSNIYAYGGKNGAGIGTGHHNGGLTGFIDRTVFVSATAGEVYLYESGDISAPQNIGYGMCYTSSDRELANATVTFTVDGKVISHPSENLVSTATVE